MRSRESGNGRAEVVVEGQLAATKGGVEGQLAATNGEVESCMHRFSHLLLI